MLLPNRVNISTVIKLVNRVNMHCFCINLWYVDAIWENPYECLLTHLGSRVAQEMNFNHQNLKDGMIFRFLTYTTVLSMILTCNYHFLSDSHRVPLNIWWSFLNVEYCRNKTWTLSGLALSYIQFNLKLLVSKLRLCDERCPLSTVAICRKKSCNRCMIWCRTQAFAAQ